MPPAAGPRLFIAGSSSAVPRPGCANSGYLLRSAGATIVADLGSGALSKLLCEVAIGEIDAIVISHMHADHFFDLIPLRYGLKYELFRKTPMPVYLPANGSSALRQVARPLKETDDFFGGLFDLREYGAGDILRFGDTTVTFAPARHYIPAYALRMQTPDGVVTFSSDTAPCESVVEHARNADIFLCECALGPDGAETGDVKGHSSAKDAGEMAARANVEHLVLTHYGANFDPYELRAAAAGRFGGSITIADDGLEIALEKRHGLGQQT